MIVYIDSSVLVRLIAGEDDPIAKWGDWTTAISSELTVVEVMRAVDRLRVLRRISPQGYASLSRTASILLGELELVPVQQAVLRRAASHFPTVIGALDAIHLATALAWQDDTGKTLEFLTHDRQLRVAAQACGFATSKS